MSPSAGEPGNETPIWRFMDLAKFTSLVFSGKLWFPKLAELWLADPWEGFGRAKGLKRPFRSASKETVHGSDFGQLLYSELSGLAAKTVRSAHRHVYANSWCMGTESLGMWERYGARARGVAIESTVGDFKRALKQQVRSEQYAFGAVKYHADIANAKEIRHDFTKGSVPASGNLCKLALKMGFNKRTFYEDEREWRSAIFQEQLRPRDRGLLLPVALDTLIRTVRVGPRADLPTAEAIRGVMRCAALSMPLEESSILKCPRIRRSR